jgi:hypothetical protein
MSPKTLTQHISYLVRVLRDQCEDCGRELERAWELIAAKTIKCMLARCHKLLDGCLSQRWASAEHVLKHQECRVIRQQMRAGVGDR